MCLDKKESPYSNISIHRIMHLLSFHRVFFFLILFRHKRTIVLNITELIISHSSIVDIDSISRFSRMRLILYCNGCIDGFHLPHSQWYYTLFPTTTKWFADQQLNGEKMTHFSFALVHLHASGSYDYENNPLEHSLFRMWSSQYYYCRAYNTKDGLISG